MRFTTDVTQLYGLANVMSKAKTTARRWLAEEVDGKFIPEINRSVARMRRSASHGWAKRPTGMKYEKLKGSFRRGTITKGLEVTVTSNVAYAGLQQYSPGYHQAKSGKKMTIPFPGVHVSYQELQALRARGETRVGKFKGRTLTQKDIIFRKERTARRVSVSNKERTFVLFLRGSDSVCGMAGLLSG